MENQQNQSATGFDIKYGNIETIPFPAGTKPKKNLGNVFIVSNGKFFGKRYAVMNLKGELITGFDFKGKIYKKIKCFGHQSILLPRGEVWSICDLNGKPYNDNSYEDAFFLHNSYLAVGQKNMQANKVMYALADITGQPKTGFDYLKIGVFSDGFAIAEQEQNISVFNATGKIAFKMEKIEIRNFCNGYAVFKKDGYMGAINTSGKVVVHPKFAWLSDCEYGRFRYSDSVNATNISNMGIVNSRGSIVVSTSKGLMDITILNEKTIKTSLIYFLEKSEGGEKKIFRISAIGFMSDKIMVEPKYLFIGEEQEGLRAFASYTQSSQQRIPDRGLFTIGYMDTEWKTVFTIVRQKIRDSFDFEQLWVSDFSKYLSPFINGTAVVQFQQGEFKAFLGSTFFCKQPYVIDKEGNRVTDKDIEKQRLSHHTPPKYIYSSDNPLADELNKRNYFAPNLFYRSECQQIADNVWFVNDDGEERIVISRLESKSDGTVGNFSCGLLAVLTSNGLWGFVNENLRIVVEPKYSKVSHFVDNAAWGRKTLWYILKRSCEILPRVNTEINENTTSLPNEDTPSDEQTEIKNESDNKKHQSISDNEINTDTKNTNPSTVQNDDGGKVVSMNVNPDLWLFQQNGGAKYYSQNADNLLLATEILKQLTSIPPQTYYMVDTPDGTLGRDINGFFTEAPINTANLKIDNPCGITESVQAQSLMGYGNMIDNQKSVALLKKTGQYAKLVLMMKCGQCGYESPIEATVGDLERQCYSCGTNNKTHRGSIKVFTANGEVEI